MKDKIQSMYFDLCDLLDGATCTPFDDIEIEVFGFRTLREMLEEHKAILESIEEELENV